MDGQISSDSEDNKVGDLETGSSSANAHIPTVKPEELRIGSSSRLAKPAAALVHLPVRSWTWFLMPMTTLGLSTLLHNQISLHSFDGLYTIGLVVYFIGLVEFFFLVFAKLARIALLKSSSVQWRCPAEEMLFVAAFCISCYGLITGAIDFSSPRPGSGLSMAFHALFWIYLACAFTLCLFLYTTIFHDAQLRDKDMSPAWLLPVLPVILTGVMAGALVDSVDTENKYAILLGGLFCAGLGFVFSISVDGIYLHRLFRHGLPSPDARPAMMVAAGPPAYVPVGLLKMSSKLPPNYAFFSSHPGAVEIVQVMAFMFSFAIFGLAILFFFFALGPIVRRAGSMSFHLNWYAFIFPNVGILSTIGLLAPVIPSDTVSWVASGGTAGLTALWIFVTINHAVALWRRSPYLW